MRVLFLVVLFTSIFYSNSSFSQGINKKDASGKRVGLWKKYHKNGDLRYEGKFLNGKEVGRFNFYEPHVTVPTLVKDFHKNSNIATVRFFTRKGVIKAEGKMDGKKRMGEWTYYFLNGKVFSIENYKNGKLDGTIKNFYANGQLTNETNYQKGVKNGISKKFSDTGVLLEEVTYNNGVLDGPAKFFDLKGNLTEEGSYQNGIKKGQWNFYVDGELTKKSKKESFSPNK